QAACPQRQDQPLCSPSVSAVFRAHCSAGPRVIEGTVREEGTGKPVVGAIIQANGNTAASAVISDASGRYRIVGLRKADRYTLRTHPSGNLPLVGSEVAVSDIGGLLEPLRADLELSRGGVVTGRVVDKATGKGVKSFVQFAPLPENQYV